MWGWFCHPVRYRPQNRARQPCPGEEAFLNLGRFYAGSNSVFLLGADNIGAGISVDVDGSLKRDSSTSVFRFGGGWRFSRNRRHKLEFG